MDIPVHLWLSDDYSEMSNHLTSHQKWWANVTNMCNCNFVMKPHTRAWTLRGHEPYCTSSGQFFTNIFITCWLSWAIDHNCSHNPFGRSLGLNCNVSVYGSVWRGVVQTKNAVLGPIRPVQGIRQDIQIKTMELWNIQRCVFKMLCSLSTIVINGGYGVEEGVNPIHTFVDVINCDTIWPINVACNQRLPVASC